MNPDLTLGKHKIKFSSFDDNSQRPRGLSQVSNVNNFFELFGNEKT